MDPAIYGLALGGIVLVGFLVGALVTRGARRSRPTELDERELALAVVNYLYRYGETDGAEEFQRALLSRMRERERQTRESQKYPM